MQNEDIEDIELATPLIKDKLNTSLMNSNNETTNKVLSLMSNHFSGIESTYTALLSKKKEFRNNLEKSLNQIRLHVIEIVSLLYIHNIEDNVSFNKLYIYNYYKYHAY